MVTLSIDCGDPLTGECPVKVHIDKHAAEADAIIVINRVKPHTDIHGKPPYSTAFHGKLDAPPIFLPAVGNFKQGMVVSGVPHPRRFSRGFDQEKDETS